MSEIEASRFEAFVASTDAMDRDRAAFLAFEGAISRAAMIAVVMNQMDDSDGGQEPVAVRREIDQMFFRVLPRIDFETISTHAEGIGLAIRFGVVPPHRLALDHVGGIEEFVEVATKGYAAARAKSTAELRSLAANSRRTALAGRDLQARARQ